MANAGNLSADLELKAGQFLSELKRTNSRLERFEKRFDRVSRRGSKAMANLGRSAKAGLTGLIGGSMTLAINRSARLADQYNQLSTRIRTATRTTGDFAKVQRELAGIAVQTGASFETTIETFQALSRVREDLGATNEQFVALTRIVNQLGVIGGASTTAVSNGLRQFNQGLSAGVFRAEEFNSIVENLPELAFRIAQGFGVTQGQLRQMVVDGQLLSEDVFRVLLSQSDDIGKQFQEIPNNLDRAFNALTTSLGQALSTLDQGVGLTGGLATVIGELAKEISILSGNASPLVKAQEEVDDLIARMEALTRRGDSLASGPIFEAWQKEMLELGEQLDAALSKLRALKAEASAPAGGATDRLVEFASGGRGAAATRYRLQGPAAPGDTLLARRARGLEQGPFREVAPKSGVTNASSVMSTNIDAMVQEFSDALDEMDRRRQTFLTLFTDNMVQAAESGFKGMLRSWTRTLEQMAARFLASKVFDYLGFGNADGGFLGLGKLFGGQRALGGPVGAGRAYLVGERGPEVFVPGANGSIVPNNRLGGGGVAIQIVDQRGLGAPAISTSETNVGGQRAVRILVRGELQNAFADGSIDRMFAASGMPVRRRGQR